MSTNRKCVEGWVSRVFKTGMNTQNLTANIDQLISYATPIAKWDAGTVVIYNPMRSVTTTRHCNLVLRACVAQRVPYRVTDDAKEVS